MEAEPALERDHALRVPRRLQPALLAALAPAGEQVEGVDAEADRDLAPAGEAPSLHRPPSHSSAHTYCHMRNWRRNLVRIGIGTAATAAFLWLFLREVDLGLAWHEIRALPGWTMIVAFGLVVANVLIMSIRWGYLLAGAGFQIGLWKLFSTVCVGLRTTSSGARRDLLRIESMRERGCRSSSARGRLRRAPARRRHPLRLILFGALAIGQGGPMLLTGIALSAGAALGVVLVALAARDPDGAERFAWKATRRLPPRWHTRFTRAAAHFVDGLGAFRGRSRLVAIFGTSAPCGWPTWPCTGWSASSRSSSTCPSARTSCSRASGTWRWPSRRPRPGSGRSTT